MIENMSEDKREIKVLKELVRAQYEIIMRAESHGEMTIPAWVVKAIDKAKNMYEVDDIKDIK